jgi:hypothetical protein
MKTRYRLIRRNIRGGIYYCVDTQTGKRTSLQTSNEAEAQQLVEIKNQAARQPAMNLQIAQVYLQHGDPTLAARTWQDVLDVMISTKTGSNLLRWRGAVKDKALDSLRPRKLIETTAEHFLAVLKIGTVSTNVYLRRIPATKFRPFGELNGAVRTVLNSPLSLFTQRYFWPVKVLTERMRRPAGCG